MESFDDIIAKLILKSSYWAMVVGRLKKKQDNSDSSFIMGISFNKDEIIFVYNLNSLQNIKISVIDKLLEHEVAHIFNHHYERAIQYKLNNQPLLKLWNVAADMAVNSSILDFPSIFKYGLNKEDFRPIFPKLENLPDGLMTEEYFDHLRDDQNKDESDGNNSDDENQDEDESDGNNSDDKNQDDDEGVDNDDDEKDNNNQKNDNGDENDDNQENVESDQDDNEEDSKSSKKNDQNDNSKEGEPSGGKESSEKGNENNSGDTEQHDDCDNSDIGQNSHRGWTENKEFCSDPNSSYIIENEFREIIESTHQEYTQAFGNLPGNIESKINEFLKPPKLPYYDLIKKLVVGSRLGKNKISYSNLNRKRMFLFSEDDDLQDFVLIPPFPGKKKDVSFNIGVVLDTSSSVPITEDGILEALSGLESILKNDENSKITLLQVDTAIREEKILKSTKDIKMLSIKGRGGTRLMPGLNRLKELKVDVSIVFTDGYFEDISDMIYSLPKNIIWVLPEVGSEVRNIGNIGHIIKYPIKKQN